ncbi:site-specific integrase [Salmonella enterica]|uniref:Site-specific integrase n=1 Tax=Salmonella enterica subsp. enterica serovar Saintpaul TaxID=90105 RepID=A0A5U9I6B1_SALET|nr:site-specific integrase [Salmonella enterica]EBS2301373.1 site-specific integrase [Salmonella enterica subsp. enterica serovar Saintpaul]EDW0017506.1 site-specific integrase [Salmonella enterica subsp. enterica serovar Aba]HCZ4727701.1 site-specific integrase [Salmonella enterica subsp. enterica serovar Saintpaul str. CFSAN004137]EBA1057090.1 site-specific integrase [Salmonella enterica]
MATIRKLPSGKWNVLIRVKGEPTKSVTRETRLECEQWLADFEGDKNKPTHTVDTLNTPYMSEIMIRAGKKRGGYEATYHRLLTISRTLNGKPLEALTKEDVIAYRNERINHVSGSTVRLELQLLSRLLRWAADEKGVECTDVVAGVKLPEPGKPRDAIVEPLQLQMILSFASEKSKPIIELAYETAMRRNEILAITPAMVDLNKRIIRLTDDMTKNGEGRNVPLSTKACEMLKQLCDGRDKHARLFNLTPYAVTQAFRRAARLAKVYGVCFHSLRHSAITRAAEKGLSTVQLMAVSGHKTITMLSRYSHIKAENVAHLLD